MATYKRVQDSYLIGHCLRYWANLVRNYNGFVFDEDFFNPVVLTNGTEEAMELLEAAYAPKAFEALLHSGGSVRSRIDPDDNLPDFLQAVWNQGRGKLPVKRVLWTMAARIEAKLEARETPSPLQHRFEEIRMAFSLSDLEVEILRCAYLLSADVLADPGRFARNDDLPLFYAMALNRSYDEVMGVLANGGKLRKFELLDEDWEFNDRDFGGFMRSSETAPLGRKYYRRLEGDVLPWDYYGNLAEKDGALLRRMFKSTGGRGRLNVLLHGAPGTGKSSFARTLLAELGFEAYEMPLNDEKGMPFSRSGRLAGLQVCQNILESGVLVIDEADALLQDSTGDGMGLFMRQSNQKTAKSLVNGLLDESKIPTIWICNTPTKCIDPSVRRRFDFSVAFRELTLEQRQLVWENCVRSEGVGAYVPKTLSDRLARDYRTNAASISIVLRNVRRLAPSEEEAGPLVERLLRNQCELTGISVKSPDQQPDKNYSLEGLSIRGRVSLEKVQRAVEAFAGEGDRGPDSPRMSILLWGPPGTGKTEYVRYLGAKTGLKVRHCSASDFLDKYLGETEKRLRHAFDVAEEEGSILFLDEIDSLLRNRSGADHSWEVSQVDEILVRMESFKGILIGATNNEAGLDPAVLRRFTFKLQFDYLDDEGKKIFFERFFHVPLTEPEERRLARIPNLAPGDFRAVRQGLFYLGDETTNDDRLEALEEEVRAKASTDAGRSRAIGF